MTRWFTALAAVCCLSLPALAGPVHGGWASFYGVLDRFGPWNFTSNGERFQAIAKTLDPGRPLRPLNRGEPRPRYWTCASRSLPFHSLVRVTNPRNGRSEILRVNDRGPHVRNRVLDLAYAAARSLGIDGVGFVHYEVLRWGR